MRIESKYPINENCIIEIKKLNAEYKVIKSIEVDYNSSTEKKYLGNAFNKKCRFCGQTLPNVHFNKVAHVFPEFTGNKSLISFYECDDCNQYFSQFENEFANFMLPYHAVGGYIGKKNKFPKYKQDITIFNSIDNKINIENFQDSINTNSREIDFSVTIPSYIPNYLYRCLIKIGISIFPEDEIAENSEILNWLMELSANTIYPGQMLFSQFPFSHRSKKIRCVISKRRKKSEELPKFIMIFSYQNFAFQTYFPEPFIDQNTKIKPFPFVLQSELDLHLGLVDKKQSQIVDLSLLERVKNGKIKFTITNLDIQ